MVIQFSSSALARLFLAVLWAVVSAWLGASTGAVAQTAPAQAAVPAEVFFRDANVGEALLSPSGKRLALTTAQGGKRFALFVYDLVEQGGVTQVAHFSNADVRSVIWLDDARLLFSALDYSEGSGTPNGAPGLFVVGADGNGLRALINRKAIRVVAGSGASRALDWNHVLLSVPLPHGDEANSEIIIGKLQANADGGAPNVVPLVLNVNTGRTRNPGFNAPSGAVAWKFNSRSEPRVVFTQDGNKRAAYWRGPEDTEWRKLVEGDLISMPFTPHTVDDSGNLYVTRNEGPEGTRALVRYDFATNAPATKALVAPAGFDFSGSLILERGSGEAQGVRVVTDAETTVWLDETRQQIQRAVDEKFTARVNRISCRRCGEPDAVALVWSYSDRDPGRLVVYRPNPTAGQTQWQGIAAVRSGVDPSLMARVGFQRIQARDGRDLPVWITSPPGVASTKPAPTVVLVHGGPWVRGNTWRWEPMAQFLASRGYLVLEPEFRGSSGYGDAHFKAGWKQWGQSMQDDVADALLWAQKQGLASDRACIAGASYGGYSTLMGLVRHPDLYRCGLAWVAVTDLQLFVSGSWWIGDDISELGRKYALPEMVGSVDKDADMIAKNSPILLASQIKAPLMLAFGEADLRVPLAHGTRLREALQKLGRDPEWITYPGEGHGWAKPETRLDFARRVEQFLAKHLAPEGATKAAATTAP